MEASNIKAYGWAFILLTTILPTVFPTLLYSLKVHPYSSMILLIVFILSFIKLAICLSLTLPRM